MRLVDVPIIAEELFELNPPTRYIVIIVDKIPTSTDDAIGQNPLKIMGISIKNIKATVDTIEIMTMDSLMNNQEDEIWRGQMQEFKLMLPGEALARDLIPGFALPAHMLATGHRPSSCGLTPAFPARAGQGSRNRASGNP